MLLISGVSTNSSISHQPGRCGGPRLSKGHKAAAFASQPEVGDARVGWGETHRSRIKASHQKTSVVGEYKVDQQLKVLFRKLR